MVTYTHTHGGRYEVIGSAKVQARKPLTDMEVVTIYRGSDGSLWVRRKSEFEDGRFTPIEGE
jgi:hypothetical protein